MSPFYDTSSKQLFAVAATIKQGTSQLVQVDIKTGSMTPVVALPKAFPWIAYAWDQSSTTPTSNSL